MNASVAAWRVLAEWPNSNFSGDGFSERSNHTLTHLPETSQFWIFGGRDAEGELLNDLYALDMEAEQWSTPQHLGGDPPAPREHHAACFVAERYLVVMGGIGADGKTIDSASVYDTQTCEWQLTTGLPARAKHRLVNRGGVLYVMGGIDADGQPASPIPLKTECFGFAQTSAFDFMGNNSQAILVKPASPEKLALKNLFTVEAVVYCRSFSQYTPIVAKCDGGLKTGFGLFGQVRLPSTSALLSSLIASVTRYRSSASKNGSLGATLQER